jgi:hypothetical protein
MIQERLFFTAMIPFLLLISCTPSPEIYRQHVTYNFRDEGFLDPDTLQIFGESAYRNIEEGDAAVRNLCIEDAYREARKKTLSVFMHTYFKIPPSAKSGQSDFGKDYPYNFSDKDYIRAEIDFGPLLEKGFIAMQDIQSVKSCFIIYRIREKDLAEKIRSQKVTFDPRPGKK